MEPPTSTSCSSIPKPRHLRRRKGEGDPVSHEEISADELRREVRALGATAGRDAASAQRIYRRLLDTSTDVADTQRALLGRRDIFRIGGFTVATAAVIGACGEHRRGLIGR